MPGYKIEAGKGRRHLADARKKKLLWMASVEKHLLSSGNTTNGEREGKMRCGESQKTKPLFSLDTYPIKVVIAHLFSPLWKTHQRLSSVNNNAHTSRKRSKESGMEVGG